MVKNKQRILVIASHPDDEVFGVGGTIVKHIKIGDEVYVVIATDGVLSKCYGKNKFEIVKKRKEICLEVAKLLGVKEVLFFNLPDAKLDTVPQLKLNKLLEDVIAKIKPYRVYTHSFNDLHKDHRVVFESTMIATRKNVPEVYCYEVLSSTSGFKPNVYVDISNELKYKLKALSYYRNTVEKFPFPISLDAVTTFAKFRGIESNLNVAEAFVCVKKIEEIKWNKKILIGELENI